LKYNYELVDANGVKRWVFNVALAPAEFALTLDGEEIFYWEVAVDYPIYRLIFETSPGRVDTGATLPGCSREHPENCDAMQFACTKDAFDHAALQNEIPVIVPTVEDAWAIVDQENAARASQGQYVGPAQSQAPTATQGCAVPGGGGIVSTLEDNAPLIIGALALWFVAKRAK
jgi:hypothetical protein